MRTTSVTIDLSALAHNIVRVKQLAPTANVLAMVKANAYGHGAVQCLSALQAVDALGVACLDEAMMLIEAGWQKPIVLIEGCFSLAEWRKIASVNIQSVIHQRQQLDWALAQVPDADHRTVWLKLNTGMNRLGFGETDITEIAKQLYQAGYQIVLTSHFANADSLSHPSNTQQIAMFERVLNQLHAEISPTIQASLCNSAGIVNFLDQQHDWVRPGIILYGATPVDDKAAHMLDLRPVMHFTASIMTVHELKQGDCVGYGSRWQADKACRIGIVCAGYADGYPRVVSDDAYVMAGTDKLPIIGRVAMDMLMVDIRHAPAVDVGTSVTLWGDAPTIDEVASWNGTISYELLCLVTKRPKWQYVTCVNHSG